MEDHQDEGGVSLPPTMRQNSIVKKMTGKVFSYQNSAFALFCYESDKLRSLLLESWFFEWIPQFSIPSEKKNYAKECLLECSPEDDNCRTLAISSPHKLGAKGRIKGRKIC
jgi:hypothetical protein